MQFKDHFSRLAAQYPAFRPLYPEPLFDYVASRCPRRTYAWNCACGNEQATLALGMQQRRPLERLMGSLRSWSDTGRLIERTGLAPVVALEAKLEHFRRDRQRERLVAWPLSLRVGCER